jgi:hypothetical protein
MLEMEKDQLMRKYLAYSEKVIKLEATIEALERRSTKAIEHKESEMMRARREKDMEVCNGIEQLSTVNNMLKKSQSVIRKLEIEKEGLAVACRAHEVNALQICQTIASQKETFTMVLEERDAQIMLISRERDLKVTTIELLVPLEH